jgi:Zn-dependent protease with chaperone function
MTGQRWMDFAGQAIFHTLVAALVVEALVRLWGVREPQQRMGFRLLALAWPLLVVPALFLVFPVREGEAFRDARSIFAGRHWDDLAFLGTGLYGWWIAGMAVMGLALFLMDLVPWLRARSVEPPPWLARTAEGERAEKALARAAAALSMAPPPLVFLLEGQPVLYCTGTRHPAIVISRAAVDLLDPSELEGALAHELAHLERRDPTLSWALMGARALMWFNPGVQVLVRALARDAERVADERAASASGDRLALASGLLKLFRATERRFPARSAEPFPLSASLAEPIARARAHDIELRCRALLAPPPGPVPLARLRFAAAAAGLGLLLFFVV